MQKNKQFSRGLSSRIYAASFLPSNYMEIFRCFEKGTRFERNQLRKNKQRPRVQKNLKKDEASAARLKNLVTRFDIINALAYLRGIAHKLRFKKITKIKILTILLK